MAGCSGIGVYCGVASNLKLTQKLYAILQELADDSLKYHGFTGFQEAEEKSQVLSKSLPMFVIIFFTFGTIFPILGMSLWNIYMGNYQSEMWLLPYQAIPLIDKSNIFEWYFEFILQAFVGYVFVLTITTTVTFFGGCSYYIEACLNQFKHMFQEIDRNGENIETVEKNIFNTIIFHNKIIEFFEILAKVYSAAIFFHLICNVLFFAGALYQTEQNLDNVGFDLIFNVLCVMEGLSYSFILCYFANLATYSMSEIANVVCNSNWYSQPPKIQKLLLLIISRGHKKNEFMGFKIIYCSLESFTKVDTFSILFLTHSYHTILFLA
ncbi:putative odorant receptor 92a [Contarinia nasturtii]|uniref:putative odorant receptor 92a n=1 Tax=Contarinia nasturtii TaxID=265458 RepID=UPI0012D44349|nr:putative odorant receptor 92a [Contarinia nasturtii]